jgi:regulator of sigma E protease
MSVLHNIFYFIVAIGVLVTFHEFGHYWVARKAGVKVLRFSVGFGKPLFSWRRKTAEGDEIDYVIAAIPLGGYVKMLDEREGNVAEKDKSRAFNNQSIAKRFAIVFAGPAFNFILAVFFYWVVFILGTTVDRPLIGKPVPESIAALAEFQQQDEVLRVGDETVRSWNEFRLEILDQGLNGGDLDITVQSVDGSERVHILALGEMQLLKNEGDIFKSIGFQQWWPDLPAEIGGTVEGGAAENAGLRKGDIVTAVDGAVIDKWITLVEHIRAKPNKAMQFEVSRDGNTESITIIPQSREVKSNEGKQAAGDKVATSQQGYIGAYQHISDDVKQMLVTRIEYSPLQAVSSAAAKTWDMSWLTLRVLWKMVSGEAALSNISGPITIATYAGVTASIGLVSFLSFLAVISVSLGVLNLLPIPMLDGGHLFYYLIEMIKGSPVSEAFELRGQQVGMVVLASLMCIAIFNDIQRLLQ